MISALSALKAHGGGDTPELAFHGIQLALENVRVGSTCFLFTDAPAKDSHLYPAVISLAIEKRVKVSQCPVTYIMATNEWAQRQHHNYLRILLLFITTTTTNNNNSNNNNNNNTRVSWHSSY